MAFPTERRQETPRRLWLPRPRCVPKSGPGSDRGLGESVRLDLSTHPPRPPRAPHALTRDPPNGVSRPPLVDALCTPACRCRRPNARLTAFLDLLPQPHAYPGRRALHARSPHACSYALSPARPHARPPNGVSRPPLVDALCTPACRRRRPNARLTAFLDLLWSTRAPESRPIPVVFWDEVRNHTRTRTSPHPLRLVRFPSAPPLRCMCVCALDVDAHKARLVRAALCP